VPVLTADPNALQDVTEAIRATLQNVNRLVADNQQSIKNSLHNLETFTGAGAQLREDRQRDGARRRRDGQGGQSDARPELDRRR
jgi:phospholipid/cholesterol/gamma-HCH transport system substrate-binding protein